VCNCQIRTTGFRGLIALLTLVSVITGCGEDPDASGPATTMPDTRQAMQMTAPYGINAEISYPGDAGDLLDGAAVTVFLRQPGSRMPLAVQHFPASQLPMNVSFSSATAEANVELVARLSPTGQVDRSPDDIEVIRTVAGFRHPPETVRLILADESTNPAEAEPSDAGTAVTPRSTASIKERSVSIPASVDIQSPHPFPPETVVFLIARRPGEAMPTVVKRLSVADLPAEIVLTDADAMTFSNRLSDAKRLELSARVSTSGNAAPSETDWMSDTRTLELDESPERVALTINRQVGH